MPGNKAASEPVLKGKTTALRFAEESDAGFILSLRSDERYNKWLSPVENDLEMQRRWIADYKEREREGLEYYFIIECRKAACGTARIYDLTADSFSWGSWILNQDKTFSAALESCLLIYGFGFEHLNLPHAHFEIMKGNVRTAGFQEKLGAVKAGEDEQKYYYRFSKEDYIKVRAKHKAVLE